MPLPVVPVQLLESLVCLAIAGLIYYLERKKRLTHRRFLVYVLLYSVARVALEFLRGDYPQHTGLTPAQWTTLLVVLPITIAIIAFLTWRHRSIVPPTLENAPPAAGKKPRK